MEVSCIPFFIFLLYVRVYFKNYDNYRKINVKLSRGEICVENFIPPCKGGCLGRFFKLSALLWNFFLCQDRWHGDMPPHLAQPCLVALGRAPDSGLVSRLVWGRDKRGYYRSWERFDTTWLTDIKGTRNRHGTARNLRNEKVVSSISGLRALSIGFLFPVWDPLWTMAGYNTKKFQIECFVWLLLNKNLRCPPI